MKNIFIKTNLLKFLPSFIFIFGFIFFLSPQNTYADYTCSKIEGCSVYVKFYNPNNQSWDTKYIIDDGINGRKTGYVTVSANSSASVFYYGVDQYGTISTPVEVTWYTSCADPSKWYNITSASTNNIFTTYYIDLKDPNYGCHNPSNVTCNGTTYKDANYAACLYVPYNGNFVDFNAQCPQDTNPPYCASAGYIYGIVGTHCALRCTDSCGYGSYDNCTWVNRSCSGYSCVVTSATKYSNKCGSGNSCAPPPPTVTATASCVSNAASISTSWTTVSYANGVDDFRYKKSTDSTWIYDYDAPEPKVLSGLADNTTYNIEVRSYTTSGHAGPTDWGSDTVTTPDCTPICNSGIVCDTCNATTGTCGPGTQACNYTTHTSGVACTQTPAPSQSCTVGCPSGSSCVSNTCVCDTPATPINLLPSGNIAAGTQNITWSGTTTTYALRVDDYTTNGWNGLCSGAQNPGDVCNNNVIGTSYSFNFIAGHQYHIWVHAIAACGVYSSAAESWVNVYTNAIGEVYIDNNGNGAKDAPADTGYAGVKVTLSNGQSATTVADGTYTIANVLPGTYTESIVIPNGYTLTYPNPYPPTVYAYSPNITQNFGIQPPPPVCNPNSLTASPSTVYVGGSNSTLTAGPCVPGGGAPGSVTYTWSPVSPGSVANVNSNITSYTPPAAGSTYTQTTVYPSVQVCNPGAAGVASACTNLGTSITVKPVFTVSGNVFVDQNKDSLQNGADVNYTGGISISPSPAGATVTYPNPSGNYLISGLTGGNYTIYYSGPPAGYIMTYPVGIGTPSFTVRVGNASTGGACSVGGSNSAKCATTASDNDNTNNIFNLNYGITNSIPWIQSTGGDITGSNISNPTGGGITNKVASGQSCGGATNYTSTTGSGGTPGIIHAGAGSYYFCPPSICQNLASIQRWVIGGSAYPDTYALPSNVIRTSYNYVSSIAKQSGITPTDIANYCGAGGIANCALSFSASDHGVFKANGSLTLTGPAINFPVNQDFVILVAPNANGTPGDLNIQTEVHVPIGSTAFFTTSGDINVASGVGNDDITLPATNLTANVQGYYSADKSFYVKSLDSTGKGLNCPTSDKRLNVAGAIVVNAALGGGSFTNQRDLCLGNLQCPAFSVIERPDFILNTPDFFKTTRRVWQEIAP